MAAVKFTHVMCVMQIYSENFRSKHLSQTFENVISGTTVVVLVEIDANFAPQLAVIDKNSPTASSGSKPARSYTPSELKLLV